MAFVELARSHVKECLREGFELAQLMVDADGDVPFAHGTAIYFVTVRSDGRRVKVWAQAVGGVKPTLGVLREVNEVNRGLQFSRVFVLDRRLIVEGILPVEGLTPDDLRELCLEVGTVADEVGQLISTVHGGVLARPDDDACDLCGE